MAAAASRKGIDLQTPAIYRICVQGRLDRDWSDRLNGMSIRTIAPPGDPPTTILEGHLADQAALSGVLNTLYDLHFPLLKVEYLKGPDTVGVSKA